ncbi:MAG: hypothetical protein PVI21_04265 [Candidatus Woesebacteria bacterium]|jgi:hypothetical protein
MTDLDAQKLANSRPKKAKRGGLKRLFSKRNVVIFVILLVLLAIGVGVGFLVGGLLNKNNDASTGSLDFDIGEPTSVSEINDVITTGDTDEATSKVESDSNLSGSIDGQLILAAAAVNAGKTDEALIIYLAAGEKYGWRADMADQVAFIYSTKGNKALAISYYEKEKTLLDTNEPSYDSQIEIIDSYIKELQ